MDIIKTWRGFQVVDRETGIIYRTLDTYEAAQEWINIASRSNRITQRGRVKSR